MSACADTDPDSAADNRTIPELAPERTATVCDNPDASGEFASIMQCGGGAADSVRIVDVRGLRAAWRPPQGVGGRNEPLPYEMSMDDG